MAYRQFHVTRATSPGREFSGSPQPARRQRLDVCPRLACVALGVWLVLGASVDGTVTQADALFRWDGDRRGPCIWDFGATDLDADGRSDIALSGCRNVDEMRQVLVFDGSTLPLDGSLFGPSAALAIVESDSLGKVSVGQLNVDDNPGTSMKYIVRGIPSVMLFKGGEIVDQVVGLVDNGTLKEMLDRQI